jgi:hypothetical protein
LERNSVYKKDYPDLVIGAEITLKDIIELFSQHYNTNLNLDVEESGEVLQNIEVTEYFKNGENPDLMKLSTKKMKSIKNDKEEKKGEEESEDSFDFLNDNFEDD